MQVPQFQFNANQYEPNQGMGVHPPASKIPFQITGTEIKETKNSTPDNVQAMLIIEFTSPIGMVVNRYNIKNDNPKTVEIAYGQLSALCRAVGIYQIDGSNECAALRGGKGLMDVGYQKGEEPDPAHPDRKGYTELKRIYDINGNDPSKPAGAPQQAQGQPQQTAQPLQQQPGGNWGQGNAPAQQAPQQQPQPQQTAPQGQAWQPGGGGQQAAPPWGSR